MLIDDMEEIVKRDDGGILNEGEKIRKKKKILIKLEIDGIGNEKEKMILKEIDIGSGNNKKIIVIKEKRIFRIWRCLGGRE